MRTELELIKAIEKYLNNELSAKDKKIFEDKLTHSKKLQDAVAKQKLILEGLQNVGTRTRIKKAKKSFQIRKASWYGLITLAVAGAVALGVVYTSSKKDSEVLNTTSENIKYTQNENGTNDWADADEMVLSQFFEIAGNKDQVVQTKTGITIAIPKGAFLDANGNAVTDGIELEVKEAITPEQIILSGLSTKSGDQLLETGGMFYINARKDGENLTINPDNPIVADVPTDAEKNGMELYQGVRKEDGSIDWQNPKPIEQFLTPVDIHSLDFYPPKYEPALAKLGYGSENKPWKDSLYYSFGQGDGSLEDKSLVIYHPSGEIPIRPLNITEAELLSYDLDMFKTRCELIMTLDEAIKLGYAGYNTFENQIYKELNPSKVQAIWNDKFQNTLIATKEFEERMHYLHCLGKDALLELYVANMDKRMSFIDSLVVNKIGGFANNESFKDEGELLFNSKCKSCHNETKESTGPPLFKVKKRWEVANESDYLNDFVRNSGSVINSEKSKQALITFNKYKTPMPDFPSLTNREIKLVMDYCDNVGMKDSLIQNGESDACLNCSQSALKKKFIAFASQNKGRVEMDLKAVKVLNAYFEKQSKAYAMAAAKTQEKFEKDYQEAKTKYSKKVFDNEIKNQLFDTKNLEEEIQLNLCEVYDQLDYEIDCNYQPRAKSTYTVPVVSTGWHNIDMEVRAKTIARETINITYKGKTAEIKYEPIVIQIKNKKEYDRVFVYLLPQELNSYQRIQEKEDLFEEKLNEIIKYNLVVIGYKGNEIFVGKERNISPESYEMELWATDKGDLKAVLGLLGRSQKISTLIDEVVEQQSLVFQNKEIGKMEDMFVFRSNIEDAIFACFQGVERVSENQVSDWVSPE